jgi:serine/threonine protein kinase/Tol biopolymer transport system component
MNMERDSLLNNRYRIVSILGQGGMGSIYRAIDENLGVEVAVKENLFTTEEYARQFRREAVILANLRHPNLPRVTDHFVIEGQGQYLVMDYIEGEDLRERLDREGVLSDEDVVIIGVAICDALGYLHSRDPQVVHRDIKPGNVKISPTGHITLVDFGLAKVVQGSQTTTTGARAMTPGYSPPEQYGTARTDQRTDIYSLGATLYVALTGLLPEDSLARAMEQAKLTPVRKCNPEVSRRLAGVIEKCMEIRPENRYQNTEEVEKALLRSKNITGRRSTEELTLTPPPAMSPDKKLELSAESTPVSQHKDIDPLSPTPPSTSYVGSSLFTASTSLSENDYPVSSEPPKRRGLGCWLIVVLVGVLIGSLFWSYFYRPKFWDQSVVWISQYLPPAVAPQIFESPFPTASLPVVMLNPSTPSPSLSPSSTVTGTFEPTSTPIVIIPSTVMPTEESTSTPFPTETHVPSPTPLGGGAGQIAFASKRSGLPQIWLMNADGSGQHEITNLPDGACQPAWSPDGERLVIISPCSGNQEVNPSASLFIINADGSGLMPLPTLPGGDFDPSWSMDGKQIAFTSLRDYNRAQVYVINLENNEVVTLSDNKVNDSQPAWSPDGDQIAFVTTRKGPYQIWLMNADGSEQTLFTRSSSLRNTHPDWSLDSQVILYTQSEELGSFPSLTVARITDETFSESQVGSEVVPRREGVYSPDGFWIAFESWPDGFNHDLFIMTTNGLQLQRLTIDSAYDFDPAWRPAIQP